jgi:DNA-binding transcriptional ArsR family regulator
MDTFTALAEPTRRLILVELRRSAKSVNELAARLDISQPAMSKHLKVLRDAGFLSSRIAAQQRIYQLEPGPFKEIAKWLEPFQRMWTKHLDALEAHLDRKEKRDEKRSVPARRARKDQRTSRR